MKRVIEIDEKMYETLTWMRKCDDLGTYYNAIADSTPLNEVLDKIRAEIDDVYENLDGYDPDSLGTLISKADEIIDKYKESEDE